MTLTGHLDEIGKPAWIGLTVVSFILFWPLGLLVLGYLIGSGRMACWAHNSRDRWQRGEDHWQRGEDRWQRRMERLQQRIERMQAMAEQWSGRGFRGSSGNRAFDEYRDETLRRLEEEQREFKAFLDRLRHAKDKAEFDQFMAEHRRPQSGPADQPQSV
jgi:Protein of unknown function (DUF2852)